VNLDEMQMMGFVDNKKLDAVVNEYVMMNQRKLIAPFMRMRNNKNKPLYTVDEAVNMVKKRLLTDYTTSK
jgi:DNA polymerase III gamma/tau subunit